MDDIPEPMNPEETPIPAPQEELIVETSSSIIPFNVFLDGTIGDGNMSTRIVKELLFWENENIRNALNQGPIYPIIFHISSFGGDVYDTLLIMDTLRGIETPVVTYCAGKAMSAAALILMAGTKGHRLVSPGSWVMIHELSSLVSGPLSKMTNTSDHLRKLQKQIETEISKMAGINKKELSKLLQNDQYFTAKQALNRGLCDKIVKNVPKIIEGVSMSYYTDLLSGAHKVPQKYQRGKKRKKIP